MKKLGIALVLSGIVGCSVGAGDDASSGKAPLPQLGGKPLNHAPVASAAVGQKHIVLYRSESIPADAASKVAKAGGKLLSTLPSLGIALVEGPASFDGKMSKDANVLASAPEHRWRLPASHGGAAAPPPADQAYPLQWDIRRVNAPAAWEHVPGLGNTTVAVIDTGVMSDHPELAGQVAHSKTYAHCSDPNIDRPGYPEYLTAWVEDQTGQYPYNCYYAWPNYQDHGTHVAGTIGANKDFAVVAGVAPGVRLESYKVFERIIVIHPDGAITEDYGADDFNIFMAIDEASSRGVSVINMSLGGYLDRNNRDQNAHILAWDRVARAAAKRGTVVVAAAGNDNANLNGAFTCIPSDLPSVISVGATGTSTLIGVQSLDAFPGSDVRAEYSNVGAAVDIAAPGGDCGPGGFDPVTCNVPNLILSSVIIPFGDPSFAPGTALWGWKAGTSMAAPHVAGVAALVRAKHPELSPNEVKDRLKATAQPVGSRQQFGAGIVDAAAATAN